jgi:hypothetical protein
MTNSPSPAGQKRNGETTTRHNENTTPDAASSANGETRPRVEPQLAHERDESASSQASASEQHQVIGQKAYQDTVGPGMDTDRGPMVDGLYNEKVAPRRPDEAPRK